jgi:hypothetical protein
MPIKNDKFNYLINILTNDPGVKTFHPIFL